ncbi:hypothetical protein NL676_009092 [Syzygium grande]|nr:hypothetical protein NL676_009092 [Syzygium grande]
MAVPWPCPIPLLNLCPFRASALNLHFVLGIFGEIQKGRCFLFSSVAGRTEAVLPPSAARRRAAASASVARRVASRPATALVSAPVALSLSLSSRIGDDEPLLPFRSPSPPQLAVALRRGPAELRDHQPPRLAVSPAAQPPYVSLSFFGREAAVLLSASRHLRLAAAAAAAVHRRSPCAARRPPQRCHSPPPAPPFFPRSLPSLLRPLSRGHSAAVNRCCWSPCVAGRRSAARRRFNRELAGHRDQPTPPQLFSSLLGLDQPSSVSFRRADEFFVEPWALPCVVGAVAGQPSPSLAGIAVDSSWLPVFFAVPSPRGVAGLAGELWSPLQSPKLSPCRRQSFAWTNREFTS